MKLCAAKPLVTVGGLRSGAGEQGLVLEAGGWPKPD